MGNNQSIPIPVNLTVRKLKEDIYNINKLFKYFLSDDMEIIHFELYNLFNLKLKNEKGQEKDLKKGLERDERGDKDEKHHNMFLWKKLINIKIDKINLSNVGKNNLLLLKGEMSEGKEGIMKDDIEDIEEIEEIDDSMNEKNIIKIKEKGIKNQEEKEKEKIQEKEKEKEEVKSNKKNQDIIKKHSNILDYSDIGRSNRNTSNGGMNMSGSISSINEKSKDENDDYDYDWVIIDMIPISLKSSSIKKKSTIITIKQFYKLINIVKEIFGDDITKTSSILESSIESSNMKKNDERLKLKEINEFLNKLSQNNNNNSIKEKYDDVNTINVVDNVVDIVVVDDDDDKECSICLENVIEKVLSCTHGFCNQCIDQWCSIKNDNSDCPLCRYKINNQEDNYIIENIPNLKDLAIYFNDHLKNISKKNN